MGEMKQVYDEVRSLWVRASPEEIVRQSWLQKMIKELDYPKHLLAVEKELSTLQHLLPLKQSMPCRRIDILCFGKSTRHPQEVFPLILIECKAESLSELDLEQALAYNTHVQAYFVAIVNQHTIWLRYNTDKDQYVRDCLPSYHELIESTYG